MNKEACYTRVSNPCADRASTRLAGKLQALWLTVGLLMLSMLAQPAWAADDNDDTVVLDGKTYHVLRNNDDWSRFRTMVEEAQGKTEVNAIMDGDFEVNQSVGLGDYPFKGTFDGNGYTLTVTIEGGSNGYAAPFSKATDYTIRNLRVKGTINGGIHSSGLVGSSEGTENHIDNCRVSATVNCQSDHVGGFIGHGHKSNNIINNCLFDGTLTCTSGGSYAGAFIGWEDGDTQNALTNCLENGIYSSIRHAGFCYRNGGSAWGGPGNVNKNNWSYHNWSEMTSNVVGSRSAADMVATLGSKNWQVVDGKAMPILPTNHDEYNFETYDIVPGTEEGEEGMLKIPYSCDKVVKWIEVSYTDSDGHTRNLGRTTLEKNTYGGFICLPATEPHKDLKITFKTMLDTKTITVDEKADMMMHNPRMLKAEVDEMGAVKLKWKIADVGYGDVLDGDVFLVQRSLTGKVENFEDINGDVTFDSKTEEYEYKDSLLISALTTKLIDKKLGIPLVRYRVVRASTQQLWGMDKNPCVAYVQPQFATLALRTPQNAKAEWSNQKEYKAKVKWEWTPNDQSHNYVWDERAVMKVEVQMFNQAGAKVDSLVSELTAEQIDKCEVELSLNRSCVNYQVRLLVDGSKSPIGQGTGDIFVPISTKEEWQNLSEEMKNSDKTDYNVILTGDVNVDYLISYGYGWLLGEWEEKPYTGNFNGNGHTLILDMDNNGSRPLAPFRYLADGAVISNLTVKGKIKSGQKFAGSIVSQVQRGTVFIENCQSSATIFGDILGDCTNGGLVALVNNSGALFISNCLFNGVMESNPGYHESFWWGCNCGGFVGWRENNCFTMLSNNYVNANFDKMEHDGSATFMRNGNNDVFYGLIQDCTYKTTYGEAQGKQSNTAPDNWCWKDGVPAVEQKGFSTPVSGSVTDVTVPEDKFYYESTGYLIENSLKAQPLQSSVVLTWKINEGGAVDYFMVMRRKVDEKTWTPISPQLSEASWEDKTCSPVYDYYYKIISHTDCEGEHTTETKEVEGACFHTGSVEGYVRFPDGTGVAHVPVIISSEGGGTIEETVYTDESGYYKKTGLPYWGPNQHEGVYKVAPNIPKFKDTRPLQFGSEPGENTRTNVSFTVTQSVKFSGYVMYTGTSIPVQGVSFLVDGREVHTASGKVTSDFEGKFAFRMLPGNRTIQAVKDGHKFTKEGYYYEDDNDTKKKHDFQIDVANTYFYDDTRVTLIGRVAGGKDQAAIPLGNSLGKNNLGDDLKMVFVLEGDNASRLVFDVADRKKTTRDEVFVHTAHDKKYTYQTQVHTSEHRMEVTPDVHTGEYHVELPPVKWKIQQITAQGYPTLFQDGQINDVIDLTDSVTLHTDHYTGNWKNANGDEVLKVDVEYHAQYNRIYHSPVQFTYAQQQYDKVAYLGERYFYYQPMVGDRVRVELAYPVRKEGWPVGVKDSMEVKYTFDHPVFNTDRAYPLLLSAFEKYYYNNNIKSDTTDVVKLEGGVVTIHNGLESATHHETVKLDENGEGTFLLKAAQRPYSLTGKDALFTCSFTLELDGTYYEATPLKAYTFNQYAKPGAKDILSVKTPVLVDILRDPPGGGSSAKLSKGSSLRLAYQMDMKWKGGLSLNINAGSGQDFYTGLWAGMGAGGAYGQIGHTKGVFNTNVDLVFSGSGQRAFAYTMTAAEDISTDAGGTMVGADADLYMGMETNIIFKPSVAIQAMPDSVFKTMGGVLAAGRMVEIAKGSDENGNIFHLVRSEVISYGPEITSTFVHSQQYLVKQLIPGLAKECEALMFTGTLSEAQKLADETGERVYWSLLQPNDPNFGVMNTDLTNANDPKYVYNSTKTPYTGSSKMNYQIVLPKDDDDKVHTDKVYDFAQTMATWVNMIAHNEREKLEASELVQNFDVDGGGSVSYSEDFSTEYTNASTYNWFATDFTHNYFANPDPNSDAYGDTERAQFAFAEIGSILGNTVGKFLMGLLNTSDKLKAGGSSVDTVEKSDASPLSQYEISFVGLAWKFGLTPVAAFGVTPKSTEVTKYNRKESFTIKLDKCSHLDFDVYRVKMEDARDQMTVNNTQDVFYENIFLNNVDYVEYFLDRDVGSRDIVHLMKAPKSFVYRTRAGATCRPWEGERKTHFYRTGTILDERTKKIENPLIRMDKQSISGVPHGEPARFKLYLTNDSEVPEAAYNFFDLYQVEKSNPKGAKLMVDGVPLTGNMRTIEVKPGQVTEKTLEVYAGEDFDYEDLKIGFISQNDINTFVEVAFSVHYLREAGKVDIASPGDKWIMNTDAPYDSIRGWYLPVLIKGYDKNQHNFDHIEFQYKESARGDDYWTNLCGFYADSTIYAAASGTKRMIPENGYIDFNFYGEGKVMEKAYDLRAVLFCRDGNSFLTKASEVRSGVKDTRLPQLFGSPEPKDGVLSVGENIVFNFSEPIEHNYLQATTNFEVIGETNETAISEEPALLFGGEDSYAQSEARRNFADKNVTIEVMVKPDATGEPMPIFSHGSDGKVLQLWLTADRRLMAVVDSVTLESKDALPADGYCQVALVLDNDNKRLLLYGEGNVECKKEGVTYSGTGPLIFGSTQQTNIKRRSFYKGRMLQARVWNRAMDRILLNTYGNQLLTGYEMGLTDYYPMNEGEGGMAYDQALGAHLTLHNATWAQPRGMSLKVDWNEERETKGMHLKPEFFERTSEEDYTLMFWFRTTSKGCGALLSNGSGRKTDLTPQEKFFIGFESDTLRYRSNGMDFKLGMTLNDDAWHHYAMTVNRAHQVANIYVDNALKASFSTENLGGMSGDDFYLGNMVWHEQGKNSEVRHQENALSGYLDGICLFEQALPPALIKRYSRKSVGGSEKGLKTFLGFNKQVRQKNNNFVWEPFALNQKMTYDEKGEEKHDSVFYDTQEYVMAHIDQETGAPMQFYQELRNLNFSYVGRDHELLVGIDELDSRVNKREVYVTLYDIPDLNGNYIASPVTAAVFIDRNVLRWGQKTYKATMPYNPDKDYTFDISIVNNSGATHTYTIENMPRWLSTDQLQDVIEAQSEQTLTFSINKDANVGTYDNIIYLTDENGLAEPLVLNITVEGKKVEWAVNPDRKQFSMNVVARVLIGDDIVTDSRDVVGAFSSTGECMGVANIDYDPLSAEAMVYMTIFNESSRGEDNLEFKLWHYATGKTMALDPSERIDFYANNTYGTAKAPVILKSNNLYVQTLELKKGWNWISFNVENSKFRDGMGVLLNNYLWSDGDLLVDPTNNLMLSYKGGQWMVNDSKAKASARVSVTNSYRIHVADDVVLEVTGNSLSQPDQRTVTVKEGWNSIGYTPMVNLPVTTALGDYEFEAQDGDVVKSQTEFAQFTEGANGKMAWKGNLKYMKPGEGYMLHRSKKGVASFKYPFINPDVPFVGVTNNSTITYASQRAHDYAHTMSLTAVAEGIELKEGDKLIAMRGAEVCGEAVVDESEKTEEDAPIIYMSISGEKKAPLAFAIERSGDIIATTSEVLTYEVNAVSGNANEPTSINFVPAERLPQEGWTTLQGIRLPGRPTEKGIYIYNGRKQLIR